MPRGGKREGAGRPENDRKRVTFWVNPEERKMLYDYLKKIQARKGPTQEGSGSP